MQSLDVGDLVIQTYYLGDEQVANQDDIGVIIKHEKGREPYEYYSVQWFSDGIVAVYCRDDLLKVRNDYKFDTG